MKSHIESHQRASVIRAFYRVLATLRRCFSPSTLHMRCRSGCCGWVAAWIILVTPVIALDSGRKADSYSIQGWFTEHGLPSNKIRALTQTRDGYLWIATAQGLARFDGNRFTLFTSTTHPELRGGGFFAVVEATDGTLWFGGDNGLFRWRNGRFDHFTTEQGLANNYVRGLMLARDGTIIALTRNGYSFIRDGHITTPGGVWNQVTGVARSYLERADGSILLGTSEGLWRISGESIEKLSGTAELRRGEFGSLLETPDGSLWIGYSHGLRRVLPNGKSEDYGAAQGLANVDISALRTDRDGNLWIGTAGGGLHRLSLNRGQIEATTYAEHFGATPIRQLCEDREGGLWIATAAGLFRLKDNVGSCIGTAEGLKQTSVFSVFEASDSTWWIGLWGGGVYHYDQKQATRLAVPASLGLNNVLAFAEEPAGTIWIGAVSGLYRYADGVITNLYQSRQAAAWQKQLAEKPDTLLPGLAHGRINSIVSDGAGGLWIATEGALYHGREGNFRAYTTSDGLPGNMPKSVIRARNGDIWVTAPPQGVACLRDGRWTSYLCGKAISEVSPRAVYEDSAGTIWVTTEGGGLNRFKGGRWRTFTVRDGLADDFISGITEDNFANLWIASPRGIMHLPREQFDEFDAGHRTALLPRIFNRSDGLPAAESNHRGSPSAWRSRDGRLLFATDRGVAVIKPDNLKINPLVPPMYIERFVVNGTDADLSRPLVVLPGNNDVQICYTAVNLLASEKVRFKIRLAPLDRDWVDAGGHREVRYAKLPPGDYTFHVIACNNDGVWNEEGVTRAFTVKPFFYQTAWFVGLMVMLVGAVAFWFYWTRRLQLAKKAAEAALNARNEFITALKQAQEEAAYERDLLRTLLDNSPDHIYFKDIQSRFIKSSNAQAKQFGVKSADELVGKTDFDFFSEEHARPAFEDEQEIIRTGQPLIGKVEKEYWKDGRVASWALTTKMPFRNKDGKIIGTFGVSKDITAIKQAEVELEKAHKQLVETSRQAGMAEVATSVLHNVGNVLNSVNIASSCVAESLKKSKAVNLSKVVALMHEHQADLGNFITNDPRGKHLPDYLAQLADHLAREQAAAINELAELQKNIEHIKDIVTMQQGYARAAGAVETVKVSELVEDTLRMNASGLIQHDIRVVREFEDVPPITVEKHKVIQILVNLVRNATHACEDSSRQDKLMTLRVTNGDARVRISVADNGIGIPPENLTRIFNHGFTTKKNGHGFGLHSGALAASEMGGVLRVHSDGPDKGATFTLELPVQPGKQTL